MIQSLGRSQDRSLREPFRIIEHPVVLAITPFISFITQGGRYDRRRRILKVFFLNDQHASTGFIKRDHTNKIHSILSVPFIRDQISGGAGFPSYLKLSSTFLFGAGEVPSEKTDSSLHFQIFQIDSEPRQHLSKTSCYCSVF